MDTKCKKNIGTKVLWKSFEVCHCNLLLILGLQEGFQVFLVDNDKFHLILSEKTVPLASVKPLFPPVNGDEIFKSNSSNSIWPLFALRSQCESEDFPRNSIKIYSGSAKKHLHVLRLRGKVYGISTSSTVLAISLEQEIHVFKTPDMLAPVSLTFDLLFVIQTFPNPANFAVVALGARWIAAPGCSALLPPSASRCLSPSLSLSISPYVPPFTLPVASNKLSQLASRAMEVDMKALTSNSTRSSRAETIDQLAHVASTLVSNLYSLGEMGSKQLSSYLSSSQTPVLSTDSKQSTELDTKVAHAGTVFIRDLKTQKLFCSFRAHDCPLAALQFDPSGSLLVTVPEDGQYLHVYKIFSFQRNGRLGAQERLQARIFETSEQSNSRSRVNDTHRERDHAKSGDDIRKRTLRLQSLPRVSLLYRVYRGITRATIRNLSFSSDSKLMAVSSSNQTTHVFYLDHSTTSHSTADFSSRRSPSSLSIPVSTISASLRIKAQKTENRVCSDKEDNCSVVSAFHRSMAAQLEDLLLVDSLSVLSIHRFFWGSPAGSADKGDKSEGTTLKSRIVTQLDFSASSSSPDIQPKMKSQSPVRTGSSVRGRQGRSGMAKETKEFGSQASSSSTALRSWWLSHVELPVFTSNGVPVWASPQFVLKTYGSAKSSKSSFREADDTKSPPKQERQNSLYIEDLVSEELRYPKYATFDGMRVEHKDAEPLIQEFASEQSPDGETFLPGLLSAAISSSFFASDNPLSTSLVSMTTQKQERNQIKEVDLISDSSLGNPGKIDNSHFKPPPSSKPQSNANTPFSPESSSDETWGVGEEEEYVKAKQLEQDIEATDDIADDESVPEIVRHP